TKQFYNVIAKLFLTAKNVHLFILDGENDVYEKSVKKMTESTLKLLSLPYEKEFLTDDFTPEKKAINDYLFAFSNLDKALSTETSSVFINSATNFEEELELCAIDILKKVRIKGKRFKQFTVVVPEIQSNVDVIKKVFEEYSIPAFFDNKVKLSDHALTKVIISILKMANVDFDLDNLKNLLFSPYFELPYEQKEDFENYLYAQGKTKRTIKFPLKDENFELIRKRLLTYVPALAKTSISSEYVLAIKELILILSAKNDVIYQAFNDAKEYEFAALTNQAKDACLEVLEELLSLLGNCAFTLQDFINIFKDGLSSKELSLVPLYDDCVFVGDFSSSKLGNNDYFYALSCNNGVVPLQKADVGLLTDKDIDGLLQENVDLEPKIAIVNDRERLNVFLGIANFNKEIHLSYSLRAKDFKVLHESEIITTFKSIFTVNGKPLTESCKDYFEQDQNLNGEYVLNNLPTRAVIQKQLAKEHSKLQNTGSSPLFAPINEALKEFGDYAFEFDTPYKNVPNAYENKPVFSVSDLETYFDCPFKNFVSRSLYAKERDVAEVKATNAGTYMHEALEKFMQKYDDLTSDNYMDVATKITDTLKVDKRFAILCERAKYKTALNRLDDEFYAVAKELVDRKSASDFKPLGQEIKFGYGQSIDFNGKTYPLEPYRLSSGELLRGSIDYADIYKDYVRVIDYKTGKISSEFSSIYNGHKFQPFIYLSALMQNLNVQPAGARYFPTAVKYIKDDKPLYTMRGHYLGELDVMFAMDNNLKTNEKSDIINAKVKPNNDTFKIDGRVGINDRLSQTEFRSLLDYSNKIAQNAVSEMRKGYIKPIPFKESCEFCSYKAICGYDPKSQGERKVGSIYKKTIVEASKNDLEK
ncbi:MAG: PD-(D/E)XK nuclease family protein, partial [Clostridia bacterium]|nr:PD-(D/E)XK nuclease family protein [Clostridia bacterium]